jgi:6-phosphogluconolactonase
LSRTDVFWADERAVPPDDPESNYGAARSLLLEPAAVPAARVHRMYGESVDLERAAASYAEEIVRVLGAPPRLDLALLGVGEDGHVASLFPGHPALREERRLVVPVTDSPKPPARRLTLTLPALTAARRVVVFATGRAKAPIVRAAVDAADARLPLVRIVRDAPAVTILLDPDAASALPPSR